MDALWFDEHDAEVNETIDGTGHNLNMKLERRRRIEELLEERRLRESLEDY